MATFSSTTRLASQPCSSTALAPPRRRPQRSLHVTAAASGVAPKRAAGTEKPLRDAASDGGAASGSGAAGAGQRIGTQLLPWFNRPAQDSAQPVILEERPVDARPILSFAGGGIFFWWELGCLKYLHRNFDLSQVQLVGASAGGLISTLAACGVDEDKAVRVAFRLATEKGIFDRPNGLAGVWGQLIREWLDELLPEDAAERCSGRVRLVVTEVPSLRLSYLEGFASKQDVVEANMASVHIPWFLDGSATRTYRGKQYIDGSLWDFILSDNSDLIKCNGEACVVDYFNDDQLKWNRLDFIKLCNLEQVQAFVQSGYTYAERTDAVPGDWFEKTLGSVRKGTVRKVLEVPVWGLRKALASVDYN